MYRNFCESITEGSSGKPKLIILNWCPPLSKNGRGYYLGEATISGAATPIYRGIVIHMGVGKKTQGLEWRAATYLYSVSYF